MLSIIVPCYNEEEVISTYYNETIKVLKEMEVKYEIIFVNDGSQDQTLNEIKKLMEIDSNIKIIDFSRNFGKESAIYAGFEEAVGDYIVMMDSDLQDPPILLKQMYEILTTKEYDSVVTYRTSRKGDPIIKSLFSSLFYKLANFLTEIKLTEGARDYRMMKREMVNAILSLKEYHRFSKGLMNWVGFKTYKISYENVERSAGSSSWSFFKLFHYAIEGIISFTTRPLRLSTYIGFIITFISFTYIIVIIFRYFIGDVNVEGWSSIMVAITFFSGVQLMSIGILGEYIARIYDESKRRPIYIKRENNEDKQ